MILGYRISGNSSNDGVFFDGNEPSNILCSECGTCLDYHYAPRNIDIHPSQIYDISYTHDLRDLFSLRFVEFCKKILCSDDSFKLVKTKTTDLFYMFPERVLDFDTEKRKTRFVKPCGTCGGFESIVGGSPIFLKKNEPLNYGFYRSDISFGSGKSKFPSFFVSVEWKELLASQKFRGLVFEEITDN